MRTLLDPEARNRQGANARRAIEPLTPSAMTLKLVLLYKELLEASIAHRAQPRAPHAAPPPPTTAAIATKPASAAPPLHGDDGLAERIAARASGRGRTSPLCYNSRPSDVPPDAHAPPHAQRPSPP